MQFKVIYRDPVKQFNYARMVLRSFNSYRMAGGKKSWETYVSRNTNLSFQSL